MGDRGGHRTSGPPSGAGDHDVLLDSGLGEPWRFDLSKRGRPMALDAPSAGAHLFGRCSDPSQASIERRTLRGESRLAAQPRMRHHMAGAVSVAWGRDERQLVQAPRCQAPGSSTSSRSVVWMWQPNSRGRPSAASTPFTWRVRCPLGKRSTSSSPTTCVSTTPHPAVASQRPPGVERASCLPCGSALMAGTGPWKDLAGM